MRVRFLLVVLVVTGLTTVPALGVDHVHSAGDDESVDRSRPVAHAHGIGLEHAHAPEPPRDSRPAGDEPSSRNLDSASRAVLARTVELAALAVATPAAPPGSDGTTGAAADLPPAGVRAPSKVANGPPERLHRTHARALSRRGPPASCV